MRSRFTVFALVSAISLGGLASPGLAGPVEDARCEADVAEAHWRQSRAALDEAVERLRCVTQRRDAIANELDATLRQIAAGPMELERVRADIRRMEADLQRATADEQRIQDDLSRMRADLDRATRSLEYVRESAVKECVGVEQWRDAMAWRDRCIDRIEVRRQVARRSLMLWPTYRELFEQYTATRSELEKLRIARVGEEQTRPVEERLERIVRDLRGYEDDALSRDPEAMDARGELDRAQREVDRLQSSIDRQLQRLPAVQQANQRAEAINASIGQAEQALQEVQQQKARIEDTLRQAREAEQLYLNGPWQWRARACEVREQLALAESQLCAARTRLEQLESLECALRFRRDEARRRYELAMATYCPPAPSRPRLIVSGQRDSHDFSDGRRRPSDPPRRGLGGRDPTPDRSPRPANPSAASRREAEDGSPDRSASRSERSDGRREETATERTTNGGSADRVTRRPAPVERG